MHILLVHRYFWPDKVPESGILKTISCFLSSTGHTVDVLSSQPSYHGFSVSDRRPSTEFLDGINVTRLNLPQESKSTILRLINALHLGLWIMLKTLVKRYDVIIVATVPPVLGAFFSAVSARMFKSRLIYYCMDLHPEIGRVSGDFANPLLYKILQAIDDWNCCQASIVLVHSEDMKTTLLQRPNGSKYTIGILNNFVPPTKDFGGCLAAEEDAQGDSKLTLVYAGNIGRFQGLEMLVDAMELIWYRTDVELIIVGDGIVRKGLIQRQKTGKSNVKFLGYRPLAEVKKIIKNADLGVVMLIPEMYKYAYPSKTMTYLEQGTPIVAAIEDVSEIANTMREEGFGFTVSFGDVDGLARLLVELATSDSWKANMRSAAASAFEKHFSTSKTLEKWQNLINTGHL